MKKMVPLLAVDLFFLATACAKQSIDPSDVNPGSSESAYVLLGVEDTSGRDHTVRAIWHTIDPASRAFIDEDSLTFIVNQIEGHGYSLPISQDGIDYYLLELPPGFYSLGVLNPLIPHLKLVTSAR